MGDPKGHFLYVNLPASQVRRRLKGFGHGVRKIQSGGRNRAVVIHTATGKNLEQLEAKFRDVGCSSTADHLKEPIENLRNVGRASASWLHLVNVHTIADLQRVGPALVYVLVRNIWPEASENLLWALAAGLKDQDARNLPQNEKNRLRKECQQLLGDP